MNPITRMIRRSRVRQSCLRRSHRAFRPEAGPLEDRTLLAIDFTSAAGLSLNLPVANTSSQLAAYGNPSPLSVAVDSSGDTYLAGQFYGTSTFGKDTNSNPVTATSTSGGEPDFFVAKYDSAGAVLWVKTGGGPHTDAVYGLSVDSTHVYIVGSYIGTKDSLSGLLDQSAITGSGPIDANTGQPGGYGTDGFVMELNSGDGSPVWAQDIRDLGFQDAVHPSAITTDASGNVYTTGYFDGVTAFNGFSPITPTGANETYVAKLNSSGGFTWIRQFTASAAGPNGTPSAGFITGESIAVDSQGNVITTGSFIGQVDLDPAGGSQQLRTSTGFANGLKTTDLFVSKLDGAGNYVFAETFGGKDQDHGQSVTVDSQNNIFVAGTYTSYIDVSQDPNGVAVGVNFDPNGYQPLYGAVESMARTDANHDTGNKLYFDTDSFALKLNPDGSYAWARSMNTQIDPGVLTNTLIAVGSDGLVYVAGAYSPIITDTGSTNPGTNLFVAQLSNQSGAFAPTAGTFMGFRTGGGSGAANATGALGTTVVLNNDDVAEGLAVHGGKVYVVGATRFGAGVPNTSYNFNPTFGSTTLSGSDSWIVTLNANESYHKAVDDYDGDGKTDLVVYRPETATYIVQLSSGGSLIMQYGWAGHDTPIQGDFDGDGRTDLAVYRAETATFIVKLSNGGSIVQQYGWAGHDQPITGDYDGDGKTDLAVYRAENSMFIIKLSGGGEIVQPYGWAGHDKPIPGDYNGDGKTDIAVYRADNATFYVSYVGGGGYTQQMGWAGHDQPVIGDYDGDGKTDYSVFRTETATFYIALSGGGSIVKQYGWAGHDIPLASVFYA